MRHTRCGLLGDTPLSIKQTRQIKRRYVKPIRPCASHASLFLFGGDVDWFSVQGRNWDVCIANIQSSTLSIVNPARVRNSQWAQYQRMETWAGTTTRPGNGSELICIQSQSRNNEPVLTLHCSGVYDPGLLFRSGHSRHEEPLVLDSVNSSIVLQHTLQEQNILAAVTFGRDGSITATKFHPRSRVRMCRPQLLRNEPLVTAAVEALC